MVQLVANEGHNHFIALDTVSIQDLITVLFTSKYLMFSDEDGNNAEGSAKVWGFQNAAGKTVQF